MRLGGVIRSFGSTPLGRAQLNLGIGDINTQMTMNVFNSALSIGFSGGATPACLDAAGYPVRNFTGTVNYFMQNNVASTNGPWVLSWPAGRSAFSLEIQSAAFASNLVNCTVNNGSGSGQPQIIGDGVHAGSVTLNFVSIASNNLGTLLFDGTDTRWASNTSGVMSLVRQSDVSAYNSGQFWTSEFVNLIKNLNPRSIRTMGWNLPRGANVDSNESLWKYRNTINRLSFFSIAYPPSAWSGGSGTSGAISVSNGSLTASVAVDSTASGWADGEMIQGVISTAIPGVNITAAGSNGGNCQLTLSGTAGFNATTYITPGQRVKVARNSGTTSPQGFQTVLSVDSSTMITLNTAAVATFTGVLGYQQLSVTGKSSGTRLILNNLGEPIGFGFANDQASIVVSNPASTFVYDKVLDAVLYGDGGLTPQPPIEAQCQLANLVGCRLWYNLPTWAVDDYVTNALNTAFSNLNGILELEYGNELWNFGFVGAQWCTQRAIVLGLSNNLDYQALQIRRIMGNLVPASSYGGNMAKINRLYMFQAGTGFGDTSITFYMVGTDLTNSSGQNAAYQAFVGGGGIDYSTSPNRPIDVCDSMGMAPYFNGLGFGTGGTTIGSGYSSYASNVAMFQSIIDNTNNSNFSAANAIIDNDIRNGTDRDQTFTVAGSPTTFTTPANHNFSNGDPIQFKVTGGTTYSGIDITALYLVLSSTATTFTCGKLINDIVGSAINVGSAGSGTTTVGAPHDNSIFFSANHEQIKWEAVAASFDAGRSTPLGVQMYEGGGDLRTPTTAECTTLGLISPNPGGTAAAAATVLANAIITYKNDISAKNTYLHYYRAFFGTESGMITFGAMPHSKGGSHLTLSGGIGGTGGEFSLCADNNPSNPLPYQWYFGFQAFNNGA